MERGNRVRRCPTRFSPCSGRLPRGGDNTSALATTLETLLPRTSPTPASPRLATSTQVAASAPISAERSVDKSIAVLAFANLSRDPENEYFSDGISEELLNVLAKVSGLRVAARTSAFYFKGRHVPIPEIARTLGVAYVVEGSVRKAGNLVRITAQLINAGDGFHLWSETFDRELQDIFAVQDEIAALIARNLQLRLSAPVRRTRTVNPDAHRLLLEGRHFWLQRTAEGCARAQAAYARALQIDPDFAEAHAGLAAVWAVRGWYAAVDGASVTADFGGAQSEAQIALRLEPGMVEAHAVLGAIHFNEGRFAESEQAFQNALRQDPNNALVRHWRAHLLGALGRTDESCAELELAARVDPLSFITLVIFASHLESVGRDAESLAICDRAIALRSDRFVPVHATRALVLWKLGRTNEAVETARCVARDLSMRPRWWTDGSLVLVLRESGQGAEAAAHVAAVLATLPENSRVRAAIHAGAGQVDEALAALERNSVSSSEFLAIYGSVLWAGVRQHPRFAAALAKLGRLDEYRTFEATRLRMAQKGTATL